MFKKYPFKRRVLFLKQSGVGKTLCLNFSAATASESLRLELILRSRIIRLLFRFQLGLRLIRFGRQISRIQNDCESAKTRKVGFAHKLTILVMRLGDGNIEMEFNELYAEAERASPRG